MIAPRPSVALMAGYHSPQLDVPVRLNTNEAPGPPPQAWRDAYAAALDDLDWHRYPDRAATALRAALARAHGVDPSWVFAANGSNEVLQTLLLAYGGPDRVALTFEPTYALHAHLARLVGTTVVEAERGADFTLDLDAVVAALDAARPAVVFLCSPNNPTGLVEPRPLVEAVLDEVARRDALLVVDEAYGQFAPWTALDLVGDDVPLVVTRTFSKTWAMAAARLGYLVGPPEVVEVLERVVLPYHLDAAKQLAGTLALDFDEEMRVRVAAIVEERGRLEAALGELDVDVWPSGANFVLFRPRGRDATAVWQAMVERGVLVRDCSSWPRLAGCLRVTIGTRDDDDLFLDALREALA